MKNTTLSMLGILALATASHGVSVPVDLGPWTVE